MEEAADVIAISDFITDWRTSVFGDLSTEPWRITRSSQQIISERIAGLPKAYTVRQQVAIHRTATVEEGATIKGPAIIAANAFVGAQAYLRGGVFLDRDCCVGPSCEIKSSFVFARSSVTHLSFVGDSLLGSGVNIEAGVIIANHRNEMSDKRIRIDFEGQIHETEVEKFGALIGDGVCIGANAVIAPGALIKPGSRVARLQLIDQHPEAECG